MNTSTLPMPTPLWATLLAPIRFALREIHISYCFIWRDLSTTMIPNVILTAAALKARGDVSALGVAVALGRALVYYWLYAYAFCLANQLDGVEEDRLNKPDRPLSSGLVTTRGAQLRLALAMAAFTIVGWQLGVLRWTLLWQVCIVLHNFGGWSKHWFTKNLVMMPLGLIAMMVPAWEMVTPMTPTMWRWLAVLPLAAGVTMNVQDLRDVEGDRAAGRRTLPIAWGEARARAALTVSLVLLAVTVHVGLMAPQGLTLPVILCDVGLAAMNLVIAARVALLRTPRADHTTYMLYTYWFCSLMGSALVVL